MFSLLIYQQSIFLPLLIIFSTLFSVFHIQTLKIFLKYIHQILCLIVLHSTLFLISVLIVFIEIHLIFVLTLYPVNMLI